GNAAPAPQAALPMVTYDGPVTIHMNGEDVQLIPIRSAHTDGDTLVRFPGLDILMTGDYYRSVGYPNIDRANGGTLNGMLEGLGTTIGMAGRIRRSFPVTALPLIAPPSLRIGTSFLQFATGLRRWSNKGRLPKRSSLRSLPLLTIPRLSKRR